VKRTDRTFCKFINHDRQAIVRQGDETYYMERPQIKLRRALRGWLRVLEGWAKTTLGKLEFVRIVLDKLTGDDILERVKDVIYSVLPRRFGLGISIGKVLNFKVAWAA